MQKYELCFFWERQLAQRFYFAMLGSLELWCMNDYMILASKMLDQEDQKFWPKKISKERFSNLLCLTFTDDQNSKKTDCVNLGKRPRIMVYQWWMNKVSGTWLQAHICHKVFLQRFLMKNSSVYTTGFLWCIKVFKTISKKVPWSFTYLKTNDLLDVHFVIWTKRIRLSDV